MKPSDGLLLVDDSADNDVLRSELWTTLFRGGYMVGKLQRSLSGKFVSVTRKVVQDYPQFEVLTEEEKNIFKKFFKQYIVCVPLCLSPANWHEHTPKKLQSPNINLCFTKFVCLKMTSVNSFLFSSCQGLVDVFVAE